MARELNAAATEGDRFALLMSDHLLVLMTQCGLRDHFTRYAAVLPLTVDRERAAFSAWYELMPRSQSGDPGRHGTFDDVMARLPIITSAAHRSEEHTSELQSLMRISYAVFCLKKKMHNKE